MFVTETQGSNLNMQANVGGASSLGDEKLILELQAHGGKVKLLGRFLESLAFMNFDCKLVGLI